jgi:hypothetical protein
VARWVGTTATLALSLRSPCTVRFGASFYGVFLSWFLSFVAMVIMDIMVDLPMEGTGEQAPLLQSYGGRAPTVDLVCATSSLPTAS